MTPRRSPPLLRYALQLRSATRPTPSARGSRLRADQGRIASSQLLPNKLAAWTGGASPNSSRWRPWRGRSAWVRAVGCLRRWWSATRRHGGVRRADPRRAVPDDRLASQACRAGSVCEALVGSSRGDTSTPARVQVPCDPGRADSTVGGFRSCLRQAAGGNDPDVAAVLGAAWPAARDDALTPSPVQHAAAGGWDLSRRPEACQLQRRGRYRYAPTKRPRSGLEFSDLMTRSPTCPRWRLDFSGF